MAAAAHKWLADVLESLRGMLFELGMRWDLPECPAQQLYTLQRRTVQLKRLPGRFAKPALKKRKRMSQMVARRACEQLAFERGGGMLSRTLVT